MKHIVIRTLLVVLVALVGYVGWRGWVFFYGTPAQVETMGTRQLIQGAWGSPETLSAIGVLDGTLLDFHSDDLNAYTQAAMDRASAGMVRGRDEVDRYDRASLPADQALTWDVMSWWSETERDAAAAFYARPLESSPYVIHQFGIHNRFVNLMTTVHAVRNSRLADHYVERLHDFRRAAGEVVEVFHAHAERGVLAPRAILERTRGDLSEFLDVPAEESVFVTSLRPRLEDAGFKPAEIERLTTEAAEAVRESVQPGLQLLRAAIDERIDEARTENLGVGALPEGARHYRALLRKHTSSEMDPDALHERALGLVDGLAAEVDDRLVALGYTEGSLGERMARLSEDARYGFEESDAGRARLLAVAESLIGRGEAVAPEFFGRLPEADIEVQLLPEALESSTDSRYTTRADGVGIFTLNSGDVAKATRTDLPVAVVHEAIPGHHLQIGLQRELGLPIIRRYLPFVAYSEGWAKYAEALAEEMGLYDDHPATAVGANYVRLLSTTNIVVDTGLHAREWSRAEARAFLERYRVPDDTGIDRLIDRSLAWPGQLTAYIAGYLEFRRLRDEAAAALGPAFSLAAFHDAVLEEGPMPMAVLDAKISRWIEGK